MAPPKLRKRTRPNSSPAHKKASPAKERQSPLVTQHGILGFSSPGTTRSRAASYSHSAFEQLPVEVVNNILCYLVQPRSRLPGLTEQQSTLDGDRQREIKLNEDLRSPPDADRWGADLFSWIQFRHPLNTLAATSKRCRGLVESYSAHLVKTCNRFNLPFAQAEQYGADSVHPSLSFIVYRRLWLQTAPRYCIFCGCVQSYYPHYIRLILCCGDCFYSQTLSCEEVQQQYHILDPRILAENNVRASSARYEWILRIDVEALAMRLYGTRAFHDTQSQGLGVPCSIPNCGLAVKLPTRPCRVPRTLPSHVTNPSSRRSRRTS